jgi:hypothetical protein
MSLPDFDFWVGQMGGEEREQFSEYFTNFSTLKYILGKEI